MNKALLATLDHRMRQGDTVARDALMDYVMGRVTAVVAERDAMRATLREIASMARDTKGAKASIAKTALTLLANMAEEAANK